MAPDNRTAWHHDVSIEKTNDEQRVVFGWLYCCTTKSGEPVVDHSGETVHIEDLERASYKFVLDHRQAGQMHEKRNGKVAGVGRLVECICFTAEKRQALGIPEGIVPDGTWVGFKIDDDSAWEGVKSGRFKMLSLGGKAIKRALEG